MSPEKQRIKIAKACGRSPWLKCYKHSEVSPDRAVINEHGARTCPWCGSELSLEDCPDYLNDLNAMHEAEECLSDKEYHTGYNQTLASLTGLREGSMRMPSASAATRAEAFLRALNLWEESE